MSRWQHSNLAGATAGIRERMTASNLDIAGLDGSLVRLSAEQLAELDSRVQCRLLRAGDPGWDQAVLVWNGVVGKSPALVLQPTSATDVAAAVGFGGDERIGYTAAHHAPFGHNRAGDPDR